VCDLEKNTHTVQVQERFASVNSHAEISMNTTCAGRTNDGGFVENFRSLKMDEVVPKIISMSIEHTFRGRPCWHASFS
jgi:hypothetical protein